MNSAFQNAISTRAELLLLHQQDSFEDKEHQKDLKQYPLHIYMICKSPIIYLDNKKTKITKEKIELTFYTNIEKERKNIKVSTINNPISEIGKIECPYPHTRIFCTQPDGSYHSEIKTNLLLRILSMQDKVYYKELDFEVLYVGQAFGEDGKRITVDRLKTHEKAQKIYFDTQQKFPDFEIWFLSMTIIPELMTMFRAKANMTDEDIDQDWVKQEEINTKPISTNQLITITEASLINYFNTYEYNKEYLNYPSKEHKSYDQCYKLDFNSTSFELSTESLNTRLWSKSVDPEFIHHKNFFLHNNSERKDMFKWFEQ